MEICIARGGSVVAAMHSPWVEGGPLYLNSCAKRNADNLNVKVLIKALHRESATPAPTFSLVRVRAARSPSSAIEPENGLGGRQTEPEQ